MKNPMHLAAALAGLAFAAPALPCGLMHESAGTTAPQQTVAQAPNAAKSAQPRKVAKKSAAPKQSATPVVAKN